MSEETKVTITDEESSVNLPVSYENVADLNEESIALINQIIAETDEAKTKDLTYLFNLNQNKKTMVRMDKLSGLQDGLVDQFVKRISERPDEISNKELMDGLKIVQDIIERGQRQISEVDQPQPLIQINQQNNSVNVGDSATELNRESRERVKKAVLGLLQNISQAASTPVVFTEEEETTDE